MNIKRSLLIALVLISLIAPFTVGQENSKNSAPELQRSYSIKIKDSNGIMRDSNDLQRKKLLLLTFFPKCFTFNCANQLKSLRDNYKDLQKANVEVWGVSTDPADGDKGQRAFAKHLNLPFPLLPDTDRKISLAFGAVQTKEQMAIRMSLLIDKDGKIAWVDKQINPRTHGSDVLERLRNEGRIQTSSKP